MSFITADLKKNEMENNNKLKKSSVITDLR